jgi:hypothetical protein
MSRLLLWLFESDHQLTKHTFSELRLECWRLQTRKKGTKDLKECGNTKNSRNKQVHKFNFRNYYYYVNSRNETKKKKWERNYNPWKKEENSIKFWDENSKHYLKFELFGWSGEGSFDCFRRVCGRSHREAFELWEMKEKEEKKKR